MKNILMDDPLTMIIIKGSCVLIRRQVTCAVPSGEVGQVNYKLNAGNGLAVCEQQIRVFGIHYLPGFWFPFCRHRGNFVGWPITRVKFNEEAWLRPVLRPATRCWTLWSSKSSPWTCGEWFGGMLCYGRHPVDHHAIKDIFIIISVHT